MTQPPICDALAIPETGEVRECLRPEGDPPPHRDRQGRPWTADTTPLLAKLLRDARDHEPQMDLPDLPHVVGVAERHLRPLGNRWLHTQAVAGRAAEPSVTVDEDDRPLLVAAAWWHDIGYGAAQHDTGLHPRDGARWLAAQGYPAQLCALVAHYSAATYEAEQRGLADQLAHWPNEQ